MIPEPAKSVNSPKFTFSLVVPLSLIAIPGSDGSRKILLLTSLRILFSTVQLPIEPPLALITPDILAFDTINPVGPNSNPYPIKLPVPFVDVIEIATAPSPTLTVSLNVPVAPLKSPLKDALPEESTLNPFVLIELPAKSINVPADEYPPVPSTKFVD